MKKYLLDSHILIWSIVDRSRLSEQVLKTIQDSNNQLLISAVSFWEIAIKHRKGKLDLENFQIQNIPEYCKN